jgi:hypothetical protein
MLTSVFELLADARTQITSTNSAIDAQRDFWVADTELNFVVYGGSLTSVSGTGSAVNVIPAATLRAH